jgi:probable O-glycosylation ligase (exosortase A-associated)
MPIRDIVLTLFIFGSVPFCFINPVFGTLMWTWLAFMSPNRLTWGFAASMPFSLLVGAATLTGTLFFKERRPLPREAGLAILLALWALFVVSTWGAEQPGLAWPELERVSKILLMTFLTILLFQDRARLRQLLMVTALSIGFYGFKGGLWGLATGGSTGKVLGPEGTFIGDPNGIALALNMVLPIVLALARDEQRRWLRTVLYATFFLSIVSILLTFSRSGFLGLVVVLLAIMPTSRWKLLVLPASVVGVIGLTSFLPQQWFDRMNTIAQYESDGSAMQRLNSWYVAWRLALDAPFTGGGFWASSQAAYTRYLPGETAFNTHSIYFRILGEQGFTGLILFVALMVCTLLSAQQIRRAATRRPDVAWLGNYAVMLRASLLGYLVDGAFHVHAYFDLMYLIVAVVIIMKQLLRDALATEAPTTETGARPAAAAVAPRRLVRFPV